MKRMPDRCGWVVDKLLDNANADIRRKSALKGEKFFGCGVEASLLVAHLKLSAQRIKNVPTSSKQSLTHDTIGLVAHAF